MKNSHPDYDTRIEQTRELEKLEHRGLMSRTQLDRAQFDTERMEQEIRLMNGDATQEDVRNTLRGIEHVQSEVRSHMKAVLSQSTEVRDRMSEFEGQADAAAESARDDADRMQNLTPQLHNPKEFKGQINAIKGQKADGARFQGGQAQQMGAADKTLQQVMEQTRDAVSRLLGRMR
jgi:hypothetical protein